MHNKHSRMVSGSERIGCMCHSRNGKESGLLKAFRDRMTEGIGFNSAKVFEAWTQPI